MCFFIGINGISGATIKHLHDFGIKYHVFTAQSGAKPPTEVSEVSSPKNILISVKNVDKLKIEISLIGYIIAFVALAIQKTVMEILQCKHGNLDKST